MVKFGLMKLTKLTNMSLVGKQYVSLAGIQRAIPFNLGSLSSSLSVCVVVCGAVVLASSPPPSHPLCFFLPLFHQCDGCLEWGLMTGLREFASHGGSILSRGWVATVEAPGYLSQAPTIFLCKAVHKVLRKPNLIDGIFFVGIWHYDSMVLCSLKEKKYRETSI